MKTSYYRRRIAQAQASAAATECADVRRIHLELAALYRARLGDGILSEARLQVVA